MNWLEAWKVVRGLDRCRLALIGVAMVVCMLVDVAGATSKAVLVRDSVVYRYATSGSASIAMLESGDEVDILAQHGSYVEVKSNEISGWVRRKAIKATVVEGVVIKSAVVRMRGDDNATVMGTLKAGDKVEILSVDGSYCRVVWGKDDAFVALADVSSDDFFLLHKGTVSTVTQSVLPNAEKGDSVMESISDDAAKQIAFIAMDYIGGRYVWGGNNLETGVDCSGFVRQVYKLCGIVLNGPSQDLVNYGTTVPKDELRYGDLVFFYGNGPGIGHIGMYVSNGYFVHAASSKSGIIMSKLDARKDYVTAKRVV